MKRVIVATAAAFALSLPAGADADVTAKYALRPPKPALNVVGTIGVSSLETPDRGYYIGTSALLSMRIQRGWGMWAGASFYTFPSMAPTPTTRSIYTLGPEVAAYFTGQQPFAHIESACLSFGTAVDIPVASPTAPAAFLAPFVGIGGMIVVARLGRAGVLGFYLESRVGYRIPLGSGSPASVGGFFFDARSGVSLGFL